MCVFVRCRVCRLRYNYTATGTTTTTTPQSCINVYTRITYPAPVHYIRSTTASGVEEKTATRRLNARDNAEPTGVSMPGVAEMGFVTRDWPKTATSFKTAFRRTPVTRFVRGPVGRQPSRPTRTGYT